DLIVVCGSFGTPNFVTIGAECRWGNGAGTLQFAFIDASCPMDLVSIQNSWFPVFRGLHMAVGHSGTSTSDTLDSVDRGSQFAAYTARGLLSLLFWATPSRGDVWLATAAA